MTMNTIADVAKDVLTRTGNEGVGMPDVVLLDQIVAEAERRGCFKKPLSKWPTTNHIRVLAGLETQRGKQLFEKRKDRFDGTRQFYLKDKS